MPFEYNPNYFNGTSLIDIKKKISFRYFELEDGVLVGMFQGNRGDKPDIDFVLRFLEPGKKRKIRTPANKHWVVDLLLKMETHKDKIKEIIEYFIEFYKNAPVLTSADERNKYLPKTPSIFRAKYSELRHSGTYSIEYIALILELFTICEKVTPRKIKMFEQLLLILNDYCDGRKDFYQVINASVAGYSS